jgi:hypothetical protein
VSLVKLSKLCGSVGKSLGLHTGWKIRCVKERDRMATDTLHDYLSVFVNSVPIDRAIAEAFGIDVGSAIDGWMERHASVCVIGN